MSDMGLGYDPFEDMPEGDLIAMYAGMNPQLFGDDPAKRLNYYQDLAQTLGFDFVQTAGTTGAAAQVPQWQEPLNPTAEIYGTDPFYASIFQAIEDGADPISAAKAAKDQLGFKGTQDEFNTQVVGVATQYASDRVRNRQERMNWERENADKIGGWTAPDGSKYKQTPLGGNDIRATASEFDLLGAPSVDDLIGQYAAQRNPARRQDAANAAGAIQGAAADIGQAIGFGAARPSSPESSSPMSGNVQDFARVTDYENRKKDRPKGTFSSNPLVEKYAMQEAKGDAQRFIDKTKGTRVRSDANINAMRRITALAGLLQGGFPE